ncbi:hypothetical protein Rsub_02911 [Raphidocelis subcapitata]|uniref:Uncharacterized protein n=1 Tax=Raphidocelis subcapitata TaxID=307507 RepID=A0A2V0NQ18_9CHLO|nr:hypothetical protein Rsub_02911 [Raphidocelis subcapitata]|eukprot:GBF89741.1 hypothetical protein Rsub_02911 [Raphidocelis subcapitata]
MAAPASPAAAAPARADAGLPAKPATASPPSPERQRLAKLWAAVMTATMGVYAFLAFFVVPRAPIGYGLFWPPAGTGGLTLGEFASIMANAAAILAAATLVQDVLWPFIGAKQRGEKVFFVTSILVRFIFIGALVYHHYGPSGEDVAVIGDSRHRHLLMSVFYASYTSDLIQIWRRPSEFTKTFAKFMVPHHFLSFAWFTPWMVFMAPRGVEGAPIWNTVFIYLCAAIPNQSYKLMGCWYKPSWYSLLIMPAVCAHWLVLLTSQAYFNVQCACSAWGCWYPSTIMMLIGAWGMAFFDIPNFMDSMIFTYTRMQGETMGFWDLGPIMSGRSSGSSKKAPAAPAPAPLSISEAQIDGNDSGALSDGSDAPVTVELILRPQLSAGGKSADIAALLAAAGAAGAAAAPLAGGGKSVDLSTGDGLRRRALAARPPRHLAPARA